MDVLLRLFGVSETPMHDAAVYLSTAYLVESSPCSQAKTGMICRWDIYRALSPLLVLLYPRTAESMVRSLVAMGEKNGGHLPIFPCWNSITGAMIGDHVGVIVADGIFKGVYVQCPCTHFLRIFYRSAHAPF